MYSLCSSSQLCNRLWETFHQQHFGGKGVFVYPLPLRLSHGGRSPFFLSLCWERISKWASRGGKASGAVPGPRRLSDALIIRLPSIPSHTPHSAAAPIWPAFYPSLALVSSRFTYPYVCVHASRLLSVWREWEGVFVAEGLAEPLRELAPISSKETAVEVSFARAISNPACWTSQYSFFVIKHNKAGKLLQVHQWNLYNFNLCIKCACF